MKKALLLATATIALSLGASVASAATKYNPLCYLAYKKFVVNGLTPVAPQFAKGKTEKAIYTDQQVKKFFQVINVVPEDLSNLKPGNQYSVHYTCKNVRGLAKAKLRAVQANLAPNQITPDTVTVKWEVSKVNVK